MFYLALEYLGIMLAGLTAMAVIIGGMHLASYGLKSLGVGNALSGIIVIVSFLILMSFGFAFLDQHIRDKQDKIINGNDKEE